MNIKLVKSNIDDLKFILKLKNSTDARKYSINNKIISLKEHKIWFSKKLKEKKTKIYIIKFNNIRAGYIRTEKKGVNNEISIGLLKKFRSKSIGKFALKRFEKINKLKNLSAKVHRKNLSSIYFFYSCGYSIYLKKKENYLMKKIKKKINYQKIIKRIENIRKKNNTNWMDILRIAFKFSPKETAKVMSQIYIEDNKIAKLSKKLK